MPLPQLCTLALAALEGCTSIAIRVVMLCFPWRALLDRMLLGCLVSAATLRVGRSIHHHHL